MSVINSIPLIAAGDDGYQISRSVRLRSSASAYFTRTFGTPTNNLKWTMSMWMKRGTLNTFRALMAGNSGAGTSTNFALTFSAAGSNSAGDFFNYFTPNVGTRQFYSNAVYRDSSAWYHVVFIFDSANATQANRSILYINGVQQSGTNNVALNQICHWNESGKTGFLGYFGSSFAGDERDYFDGYLTEVNFIDGQALTPSSFGETDVLTGVWKPKKYAGTYGTNGFYLNFSDNSAATAAAIGKDSSGNGNNWTPNNISVTAGATYDSMLDVPTMWADGGSGRGNYCVLSPLDKDSGNTVVDGNLKVTTSSSGQGFQRATMFVNSGKWYWEVLVSSASGNSSIGIAGQNTTTSTSNYIGATSDSYGYVATNGNKYNNGSSAAYGATYTTGNVIGVALDMDAGTLTFYKDNASQGTAYSSLSGYFAPALSDVSNSSSSVFDANFGQRPFAYTPPTGFKALNTQNLPDATIKKGNAYFDVSLYTGNAGSKSVSNAGFQPDFVWLKERGGINQHNLVDAVRGAAYRLRTDATNAEEATPGTFTFDAAGFTTNTTNVSFNGSGQTYAAWQWKESASAGFDIVTQTLGTTGINTMSHSLGVAPKMILAKRRDATEQWLVYHASGTTQSQYLGLNTTAAVASSANLWGSSALSSSQFYFSGTSGTQYLFYLFAEVAGFSKFGSYTGNGSADGPFVYCGFRPRFILVKRTDAAGANWSIYDTARNVNNVAQLELYPNASTAETTSANARDFLSNGFKLRTTDSWQNASGGTYIYAAFAENPTKYSLAR